MAGLQDWRRGSQPTGLRDDPGVLTQLETPGSRVAPPGGRSG